MNNSFIIGREFLVIILSISILNFILEAYYVYFISDKFCYMGYVLDFNIVKYIESKILFLFFLILSLRIYNLSKFMFSIFILLIFFFFIPNSIIFSFSDKIRGPLYSVSILPIVFFIFLHFKIKITSIKVKPILKHKLFTFIIILLKIPISFFFYCKYFSKKQKNYALGLNGASLIFSKQYYQKFVKTIPEITFMYGVEFSFNYRRIKNDFKFVFDFNRVNYHYLSSSTKELNKGIVGKMEILI